MEKELRRRDWIGGFLISLLFVAVAAGNLLGYFDIAGTGPFLNITGSNATDTPPAVVNLGVPDWAGIAETVSLLLTVCYVILLLPRLHVIVAGIISFIMLAILLTVQAILFNFYSLLIPCFFPALLIIMGTLHVFISRILVNTAPVPYPVPVTQRGKSRPITGQLPNTSYPVSNQTPAPQDKEERSLPLQADTTSPSTADSTRPSLGRYTIVRKIGKGAMGVVYLGQDTRINRTVAIKTLPLAREFDASEIDEVKARFFREAETAGRLAHPNIVTIYDAGEDQDLAYIAMEYLKGHDLKRFIRSNKLLPLRTVIQIVILAADALHYAHQQNVIHRDIKPGNIMFLPESATIKITDFGIARITDSNKTRTGIVLGTPSYMSPEQLMGNKSLDGRTDLFSLGVMFYQLLCGELPFTGESMAALMVKIAREPHRDIAAIQPDLVKNVPAITRILDKILAKEPERRYQTGSELSQDLRSCLKNIKKK